MNKGEKEEKISALRRIRWVDKYHTFHKIVPGVEESGDDEKDIIINIIEDCCTSLIKIYNGKKKPTVAILRQTILKYMDEISYAEVSIDNKDFGYELCWYIGEKIDVEVRKYSDTKIYGYWKVQDDKLKAVKRRGKKPDKKDSYRK